MHFNLVAISEVRAHAQVMLCGIGTANIRCLWKFRMGYRSRAYRYDHSTRVQGSEPAIVTLVIILIAAVGRSLWRLVRWGWGKARGIQVPAPAPPPPIPLIVRRPSPPQSDSVARSPLLPSIPYERPAPRQLQNRSLPYRACHSILTDGEKGLWEPLHLATEGKYMIFAKVRLVYCQL